MSGQFCEHESAAIRASKSGAWDAALRTHADSCEVCTEALKLFQAMNMIAQGDPIPAIPDPQRLWLKAAFAERQRRDALATRIAGVAYAGLAVVLLIAAHGLLSSRFSESTAITAHAGTSLAIEFAAIVILLSVLLGSMFSMSTMRHAR